MTSLSGELDLGGVSDIGDWAGDGERRAGDEDGDAEAGAGAGAKMIRPLLSYLRSLNISEEANC